MIAPPRRKPRRGRLRDAAFLGFVRSLPCPLCWKHLWPALTAQVLSDWRIRGWESAFWNAANGATEAAHVGLRGLGQKCSDRETIPLCATHHRTGKDSHHVLQKSFWKFHGIDKDALIAELNRRYESERESS